MSKLTNAVAVFTCGLTLAASAGTARADEVSPKGKGIVGGALLGGEIVTIPMSLFHVKSGWAYAIGGGLGMIGGGVGGYFIEKASFSSDGRVPIYMLAGGMALVIPTVVLILNATRYQPTEGAVEDKAPGNEPPANPGAPGGSMVIGGEAGASSGPGTPSSPTPAPATPSTTPASPPPATTTTPPAGGGGATPPAVPLSLLDFHGRMRLGLPLPEIRESYTQQERKTLGVSQDAQLRFPLVSGRW